MEPLNLKETALKEEIKEILEELENMYEISELEEQVNNINKIRDYIINLQQENKKQKEVINKAMIELDTIINDLEKHGDEAPAPSKEELCKVFNILNEVSK